MWKGRNILDMHFLYKDDSILNMKSILRVGENLPVKVDIIISDPPYGMNYKSNKRAAGSLGEYDLIKNDDNVDWLPGFLDDCLKVTDSIVLFCSHHKIDIFKMEVEKRYNIKNILIWEKEPNGMGDLKGAFAVNYEFIIYATNKRIELNGKREASIFRFNRTKNQYHRTEKPVDLMEHIIQKITQPGWVVLDPFMGSGTTGVACQRLGRKFIGIEIDDNYFITAKRRIETTDWESGLNVPVQTELFNGD